MFCTAELAERHGKDRPAVVPELDGAQRERLNRALIAAALDVFADRRGVVEHVEDAAQHVLDQGL